MNRTPEFVFPHRRNTFEERRYSWARFWLKVAALVLVFGAIGVLPALAQIPAGMSKQALVEDDLNTHLDGGESLIPWAQISATALAVERDYNANEFSADRRYAAGPDVVVSGQLVAINKTVGKQGVLVLVGSRPSVGPQVFLKKTHPGIEEWAAGLKAGQKISVACTKVRRYIGTVVFAECAPRADYVRIMAQQYVQMIPVLAKQGQEAALKLQALK